jgi:hypothetical protein
MYCSINLKGGEMSDDRVNDGGTSFTFRVEEQALHLTPQSLWWWSNVTAYSKNINKLLNSSLKWDIKCDTKQKSACTLYFYSFLNHTCILLLYIIWIQNFVKVTQVLNKLWNVKYTIQSITGISHKVLCCYTRFIICEIRLWVLVGNQLDAQFLLLYVYLNPLHVLNNPVLVFRRTIVLIHSENK